MHPCFPRKVSGHYEAAGRVGFVGQLVLAAWVQVQGSLKMVASSSHAFAGTSLYMLAQLQPRAPDTRRTMQAKDSKKRARTQEFSRGPLLQACSL